jgi:3-oxoacyl-(acyl-carrier-protein) synthase
MKQALANTRPPPDAIDGVNVHATTPLPGDVAETKVFT